MKNFKDFLNEKKKSKIEEFLSIKKVEEQQKWILKNLYPYSGMKPRKTKNGFNLTPSPNKKWMVEFSDINNHLYSNDFEVDGDEKLTRVVNFPQAFFIYDKKFGEPIKEVWLEEFFEDWITQHFRGW